MNPHSRLENQCGSCTYFSGLNFEWVEMLNRSILSINVFIPVVWTLTDAPLISQSTPEVSFSTLPILQNPLGCFSSYKMTMSPTAMSLSCPLSLFAVTMGFSELVQILCSPSSPEVAQSLVKVSCLLDRSGDPWSPSSVSSMSPIGPGRLKIRHPWRR